MKIPAGSHYIVEVDQFRGLGSAWTVRVYRKFFFMRRLVSSDWFLNAGQAETFAREAARELERNGSKKTLNDRKPGWMFHRPLR